MGHAAYTPEQRNWKWFSDSNAEPVGGDALAGENTEPTLSDSSIIRLRIDITETGGDSNANSPVTLEYSTDDTNWNSFGAAPQHWNYANGLGTDGNATTTYLLTGTTEHGEYIEAGTGNRAFTAALSTEIDIAIQQTASASGSQQYYFRVSVGGAVVSLGSGETHASVKTAGTQYNMPADSGTYSVSGTAANLEHNRTFTASSGSYAVTGTSVTLQKNVPITATSGTYAVNGTDAGLRKDYKLTCSSGSYSVAGTDVVLDYVVPRVKITSLGLTGVPNERHKAFVAKGVGQNYNLACSSGSFSVTGTAAGVLKQYKIAAASGSYSVTGSTVAVLHSYKIPAASGTYTETGTTALLTKQYLMAADTGVYSESGTSVVLKKVYTLAAASGSYSVSGTDASLVKANKLATDSGSYSVSGTAANLKHSHTLPSASGSYSVSGTDVVLYKGFSLAADSGSYALSGTSANLEYNRVFVSDSGSYSVTGTNANLKKNYTLAADSGSYSVAGTAVTLSKSIPITATSGSYSISGTATALKKQYKLTASSGSYSVNGTAAVLTKTGSYALIVDSGSYAVNGTAVNLKYNRVFPAATDSYAVNGTTVNLKKQYKLTADSGSYSVSGTATALVKDSTLTSASGSYAVTGTDTALKKNYTLVASSGSYTVTGTSAAVLYNIVITAGSGSYTVTGTDVTLDYSASTYSLACDSGSYSVSGTSAALHRDINISASSGSYAVTGTTAGLTYTEVDTSKTRLGLMGVQREKYAGFVAKLHDITGSGSPQATTATATGSGILHTELVPGTSVTKLGLMGIPREPNAGFVAKAAAGGPQTITGSGTPQAETATTVGVGGVNFISTSSDVQAETATSTGSGTRTITGTTTKDLWFFKRTWFFEWFNDYWFSKRSVSAETAEAAGFGGPGSRSGYGSGTATTASASGIGYREIVGTATVVASTATTSGVGTSSGGISGYGVTQAETATVLGLGFRTVVGTGTPQARTAVGVGVGQGHIVGIGNALATTATVNISANYLRIRPMAQYLEIVNEILDELNEVRLTTANFDEARNIQRFVKSAVNRAYRDIHNLEYKWPWTTFSSPTDNQLGNTYIETEAGTRWYLLNSVAIDVDSDYGYVDWDHFMITTEGVSGETAPYTVRRLALYPAEEWQDHYAVNETQNKSDSTSYGTPTKVMKAPDGRRFGLSPIPDKAYRVYFTAYNQITVMTNYDDEVIMPSQWIPVLIARARYYAWQFKQEAAQAQLADQDFKDGMKQMRRALNPIDKILTDDRMRAI